MPHAEYDAKREECVLPHTWRLRDRVVRVQAHDDGSKRRCNTRRDEHRAKVHARLGQDRRIDNGDVRHRQERGQSRRRLDPGSGRVLVELEKAL